MFAIIGLFAGCGEEEARTQAIFVLEPIAAQEDFYQLPYPSDLRTEGGFPELSAYPNPDDIKLLGDLLPIAQGRRGFSTTSAVYFRFTGPLAALSQDNVISGDEAPIFLIDVDPDSPERGRRIPVVAQTLVEDNYVQPNVLAVAAVPGVILAGTRTYALVIRTSLGDAEGRALEAPANLRALMRGDTPGASLGARAHELYEPVWETLDMLEVPLDEVAAATVFTTGDVVAELAQLSDAVLERDPIALGTLQVDPVDGDHERFCELIGSLQFPQFQTGTPPFNDGGIFEIEAGLPVLQRMEEAPYVVTLPKGVMPAGGYPLAMYFHGSGGKYQQVVDRNDAPNAEKGEGPSYVLAAQGFASVGSAHPLNPERFPGASDIAYINLNNLSTLPFTFAQGAIEQRLLLDALLDEVIPESALAGCTGMSLPEGASGYTFAREKVVAMGQSMGGAYTNMVGAIEPRIKGVVPTGAGGLWHYFILETSVIEDLRGLFSVIFRTPREELSFLHPSLQLLGQAWEQADPMVYMARLGKLPLPGHPTRPVFAPVAPGDSFFPTSIYDAAVLAYGNQQAGDSVWSSMQEGLSLLGLGGIATYPVVNNLMSADASPYTGVVVQYEALEGLDPHSIFAQRDDVKYQYGCFFESLVTDGVATLPAPGMPGAACP